MMKYRITCAILLSPLLCFSQPQSVTLTGSLGVESGETFTYLLSFTDSAGVISGHATTYLQKEKDTRATLIGTLDRSRKTLSFTETAIVYNNGFRSNAIICLINSTLTYRQEGGRFVLVGPVTSRDVGNASCSRGSVRFEDTAALVSLFHEAPPPPQPPRPATPPKTVVIDNRRPPRTDTTPKQTTNRPPEPAQITEGREQTYEWQSDTIVFEIRDGNRIDGDVVTVRYNDVTILDKHILTAKARRIVLPVPNNGSAVISVIAGYEGSEPPNTANITLYDGDIIHEIIANNRYGRVARIKIRKK